MPDDSMLYRLAQVVSESNYDVDPLEEYLTLVAYEQEARRLARHHVGDRVALRQGYSVGSEAWQQWADKLVPGVLGTVLSVSFHPSTQWRANVKLDVELHWQVRRTDVPLLQVKFVDAIFEGPLSFPFEDLVVAQ